MKGDTIIRTASGSQEICELWKEHYESLLNSVETNKGEQNVHSLFAANNIHNVPKVTAAIIKGQLLSALTTGQAKGNDGIQALEVFFAKVGFIFVSAFKFNVVT